MEKKIRYSQNNCILILYVTIQNNNDDDDKDTCQTWVNL